MSALPFYRSVSETIGCYFASFSIIVASASFMAGEESKPPLTKTVSIHRRIT
ncbi:hypothetical protein [Collimonas pratensis]|uniref:Uncharacterized protein n=1 Tax=Collimonas pratensis TaxID=279113 RepID=A0A127Q6A4_9BURK|nr:hypothetical protein [Collimonas pratensis]AMP05172.1 hypothetical protein CPter91_2826 [Collimonas pratensis]